MSSVTVAKRQHAHRARAALTKLVVTFVVAGNVANIGPAQSPSAYNSVIQQGKMQLQAGHADEALATAEQAIKLDAKNWEGYALAGGALMNLKRYDEAITRFGDAMERAPQDKQAGLSELLRQCFAAESGTPPSVSTPPTPTANNPAPEATTTQAEIVLWKSIENSTNPADFQAYLSQYPDGAFVALAHQHLRVAEQQSEQLAEQAARDLQEAKALAGTVWDGSLDVLTDNGEKVGRGFVLVIFTSSTEVTFLQSAYGVDLLFRQLTSQKYIHKMESDALTLPLDQFANKYSSDNPRNGNWTISSSKITLTFQGGQNNCGLTFSGTLATDTMQMTYLEEDPTCNKQHGTFQLRRVTNPASASELVPTPSQIGNAAAPAVAQPGLGRIVDPQRQSSGQFVTPAPASQSAAVSPGTSTAPQTSAQLSALAGSTSTSSLPSQNTATSSPATPDVSQQLMPVTGNSGPTPGQSAPATNLTEIALPPFATTGATSPANTSLGVSAATTALVPPPSETVGVTIAMLPDPPKSSAVPASNIRGSSVDRILHWMAETAPQNPSPETADDYGLTTYIVPGSTCAKTGFELVPYRNEHPLARDTSWITVDLGQIDPAAVTSSTSTIMIHSRIVHIVNKVSFGSAATEMVTFADSEPPAAIIKANREGKTLKTTLVNTQELRFGSAQYASQFARPLAYAAELCGGRAETPSAGLPF